MLKLRFASRYIALILLAFLLTSCPDKKEPETVINQTDSVEVSSESSSNETPESSITPEEISINENPESSINPEDSSSSESIQPEEISSTQSLQQEETTKNEDFSDDIPEDSSESQITHWTTLLVVFLVLASVIMVVIYSLFDVKHIKGPVFKLTRKQSQSSEPENPQGSSNQDLEVKEPEVKIPSSDIEGHIAQQSQNINELKKDLANLLKTIEDMNQTFLTLRDNLDQKDEELARYKDGYDATIFKNFILRFTRVDKVLKENINDQNFSLGALEDVQIQMEDALAECNIEIFSPSVGDDYQTTEGIADNPKQIETSKKGDNLKIAEIIQPGYRRKIPGNEKDDFQIITEAKVAIYVYKDN